MHGPERMVQGYVYGPGLSVWSRVEFDTPTLVCTNPGMVQGWVSGPGLGVWSRDEFEC